MHHPYANVVNGGLIDFHDTAMLQAQPVHASMVMPVQQQPSMQNGIYYVGQPQGSFPVQSAFAGVQPSFPAAQTGFAGVQPSFSTPQPGFSALPQAGAQAAQCFTGPPSFVHYNGQTYKPVEDGASTASSMESSGKGVDSTDVRGLDQKIEDRVSDKVNEFMEKERARSRRDRSIESNAFHKELAKLNEDMRKGSRGGRR